MAKNKKKGNRPTPEIKLDKDEKDFLRFQEELNTWKESCRKLYDAIEKFRLASMEAKVNLGKYYDNVPGENKEERLDYKAVKAFDDFTAQLLEEADRLTPREDK